MTIDHNRTLGPGVSKVVDLFDQIGRIAYRRSTDEITIKQAADQIVGVAANEIEFFIFAADVYVDLYEVQNDVQGVRLWSMVKKELLKEYFKKYKKHYVRNKRTNYEKIMHVLMGGFEETEKKLRKRKRSRRR